MARNGESEIQFRDCGVTTERVGKQTAWTAGKLSGYDPSDTYDHLPEEYIEALEHFHKGYLLGNIRFFNNWYLILIIYI